MKDDELQTVFTTTHPAEAEMVRVALENEGIVAFVDGANQAGLTGVLAVHVSVTQKDAARAQSLVEELGHTHISEQQWEEALEEGSLDEGVG